MHHHITFIVLLLLGVVNLTAQNKPSTGENQTYQSGEKLTYSLKYGFIKGGYISFTVKDTLWEGTHTQELKLFAKTSGMVDAIFKVRDTYISYIDPTSDQPLKSVRDIREGRYKYYNEVTYDYTTLHDDSITIHSKKSGNVRVPPTIHDIVSAFYYARRYKFNDAMKVGDILEFTTYFSDEIFPLKIKYMGNERISTAFGNRECYLFHPVTEVGRVFETEEDMKVWVTRDKNRIPIKAKVNLKVGSFSCDLTEHKGLKNKLGKL
ncbi:DUF3108 domain-containing protein [Saccharicrinis fermentans]|uniref:DUF3108 domain-containing protein n=1 Tax=Saccharicrinis fermentans TaxID=982 RepID=UPI000693569D|nr:DUF3108 domain-containing protein [Saccharicrinis fermentans]